MLPLLRTLGLLVMMGSLLHAAPLRLRLPVEEANPTVLPSSFGERELAEVMRNPKDRDALVSRVIDVVGEVTLFDRPHPETGLIHGIGFNKTHGTVIYRVWCRLKEPITKEEFDRISNAAFVTIRGKCSVHSRTKPVGSDLWYDLTVTLTDGSIVYLSQAAE